MKTNTLFKQVFKYLLLALNIIMCAFIIFIIAFNCFNLGKIRYVKPNVELYTFSE
ncbi:hypothetical protein OCHUTO_0838 [Orientia chuto str. Dubai]|uniref:Uncharacterized protein n=1 Tax=Orientia chuto str. Dubai TaxID=1359168 RepID=A0A0F3MI52_9RICK|nr:hypothetical protein OCHUTO_0838 [Orientia chuto str. Dubai]